MWPKNALEVVLSCYDTYISRTLQAGAGGKFYGEKITFNETIHATEWGCEKKRDRGYDHGVILIATHVPEGLRIFNNPRDGVT